MKNKKYVNSSIVLLFVVLFSFPSLAQISKDQAENWRQKYWYYRGRLKNDFMLGYGSGPGESMPFGYRNDAGNLTIIENPASYLGTYIGVLAMEYHLLKKNGQDYSETIKDLYYSLYAINRIDLAAESYDYKHEGDDYCPKGIQDFCEDEMPPEIGCMGIAMDAEPVSTEDLNGFFIRDDVCKFVYNGNGEIEDTIRYELTNDQLMRLTLSNDLPPVLEKNIRSQFMEHLAHPETKIEESQDEAAAYLLGLALVEHLLDEDISFNNKEFQDGEVLLQVEARAIAERIVGWFATQEGGGMVNHWHFGITNPVNKKFVENGCHTLGQSWGWYKAAEAMGIDLGVWDYSPRAQFWKAIWRNVMDYGGPTNAHRMYVTLASIGDSWNTVLNQDRTLDELEEYMESDVRGTQFDSYLLYHYALHGDSYEEHIEDKVDYYAALLDLAPCSIPRKSYLEGEKFINQTFEWSGGNRHFGPDDRGLLGWNPTVQFYSYGADFMFLMNLFFIAYDDDYSLPFPNMSNEVASVQRNYIQQDYPDEGIGSHIHPKVLKGFETVVSDKEISSQGDITFAAQEKITLKPGFKANKGCEFTAKIDDNPDNYYDCSSVPTPESSIYVSSAKELIVSPATAIMKYSFVEGATSYDSYLINATTNKEIERVKDKTSSWSFGEIIIKFSKGVPIGDKALVYTSFYKKGEKTHKPVLDTKVVESPLCYIEISHNDVFSFPYHGINYALNSNGIAKKMNSTITHGGDTWNREGVLSDYEIWQIGSFNLGAGFFVPGTYHVKTTFSNSLCTRIVEHDVTMLAKEKNSNCIPINKNIMDVDIAKNEFDKENRFNLFPNPSSGSFLLDYIDNTNSTYKVNIFNINGDKVYEDKFPVGLQEIDLSSFSKGVYLVRITTASEMLIKKLFLQ